MTYQPPGLPLVVSLDTSGHLSVSLSRTLVTPIGTFGVGGHYATENRTYLYLTVDGQRFCYPLQGRSFDLDVRGMRLNRFVKDDAGNLTVIASRDGTASGAQNTRSSLTPTQLYYAKLWINSMYVESRCKVSEMLLQDQVGADIRVIIDKSNFDYHLSTKSPSMECVFLGSIVGFDREYDYSISGTVYYTGNRSLKGQSSGKVFLKAGHLYAVSIVPHQKASLVDMGRSPFATLPFPEATKWPK